MDGVGEGALLTSFVEVENKRSTRREKGVDCALSWALILRTSGVGKMSCTGSSHELRNEGQYGQGYSTAISIHLT